MATTDLIIATTDLINTITGHQRIHKFNKAGFTAIPVADGWAGAEMRGFTLFDLCTDGPTDGWTDGRTDKGSYRVACPQLKKKNREEDRETWNGRGGDRLF